MNDEFIQTVVMDVTPKNSTNRQPATAVADKIQASINERHEASSDEDFIQTYSYLT